MVHHRVLQFCLQGFLDVDAELALFTLLNCMSKLCSEFVDVAQAEETVAEVKTAVVNFENMFPQLMVIFI